MNPDTLISTRINSIKTRLLCTFVLLLPFSEWMSVKLNSFLVICLASLWLAEIFTDPQRSVRKYLLPSLALTGLFWTQCISLFHGGEWMYVERNFMVKLPLLFIPLAWTHYSSTEETYRQIRIFFLSGCTLAVLISFRFLADPFCNEVDLLNYRHYEEYLVLQRPYFGIYLLVAILFLIKELKYRSSFFFLFLIFFFVSFLFLIQAKTAMIIFLLIMLIELCATKKKWIRYPLTAILVGGLITGSVFLWQKYEEKRNKTQQLSGSERHFVLSINTRMIHFTCGASIIKDHPLTGAGAGNVPALMRECYDEQKASFNQYGLYYNIHNEFLEETARHGLCGLLIYLICFVVSFHKAIRLRDRTYIQFLLIILIASVTETLFSRAQGVLFFVFFHSMFFFQTDTNRVWKKNES